MLLEAKGQTGTVTFDGQWITIKRTGMQRLTFGSGEKRISVRSISAVQWKPASFTGGFIQFTISGGKELTSRHGRRTTDASKDENSVVFHVRQQPAFEQVRDAIERAIASGGAPATAPASSAADELAKLATLRDQGILTDTEFAAAKARLLG